MTRATSSPRTEVSEPLDSRAVIGGGGFGGIGSPRALVGHGTHAAGTDQGAGRCPELGGEGAAPARGSAGGAPQRFIGRCLAAEPSRRSRIALADKVGVVDGPDGLTSDLS